MEQPEQAEKADVVWRIKDGLIYDDAAKTGTSMLERAFHRDPTNKFGF